MVAVAVDAAIVVATIVVSVVALVGIGLGMPMSIYIATPMATFLVIARRVHVAIPVIAHEIHRSAAGVVSPAVLAPMAVLRKPLSPVDIGLALKAMSGGALTAGDGGP